MSTGQQPQQRRTAGRSSTGGGAGRSSASRTPRGGGISNSNRGRNQRRNGGRQKRPEESSIRDEVGHGILREGLAMNESFSHQFDNLGSFRIS